MRQDKTDHACPICHSKTKVKGFNCIGFACAAYAHGGGLSKLKSNCSKNNGAGLGNNATLNHNIKSNWKSKNGKDWQYITNGGSLGGERLKASKLKKGDILICFDSNGKYKHVAIYIGNGQIVDSTSSGNKANNIKVRQLSNLGVSPTRAFRYIGN